MTNDVQKPRSKRWVIALVAVIAVGLGGVGALALLSKKDTQSYLADAEVQLKKGDLQAALIQLKNAVQRDPGNGLARYKLAQASLQAGDAVSAEKEIKIAQERGLAAEQVLPVLAAAYIGQGKYQVLLDTIPEGQRQAAAESEIRSLRGTAFLATRNADAAEASFQSALKVEPQKSEAVIGLARVDIARQNFGSAEGRLDSLLAQKLAPDVTAEAYMLKAYLRRQNKDSDGALAAYNSVLEIAPSNLRTRLERAHLMFERKDFDKGAADVKYVLSRASNHPIAVNLQAWLFLQKKEEDAAYDLLQRQGMGLSRYAPNLLMMARLQLERNQSEAAQSNLAQYLQADPGNTQVRLFLANLLIRKDLPDQAITVLRSGPPETSEDVRVLRLLATASMRAGRVNDAGNWLDKASSAAPDAPTRTQIAVERIALGQTDAAIKDLDSAIEMDPKATDSKILLIVTTLRQGKTDEAEQLAKNFQAEAPDNPIADNLLGGIALLRGDREGSRKHFESALRKKSDFRPAQINLAKLDMAEGKLDEATKRYREIVEAEPNVDAMLALADLAQRQSKSDEAQSWLTKAIAADTKAVRPRLAMINLQLIRGDKEGALKAAREVQQFAPNHPDVIDAVARAQFANGDIAGAAESYRSLVQGGQTSPVAYTRWVQVLAAKGDYGQAKTALRAGVAANPDSAELATELVTLLQNTGEPDEALKVAKDWQGKHAQNPAGDLMVAEVLLRQGKAKEAIAPAESAYKKAPSSRSVVTLARARADGGDRDGAVSGLRQWLQSNETDATALGALVSLHLSMRQHDAAISESEKLLQVQPNNPIVLNNLAWLYSQRKDPKALEFAERAHAAAPQSPAIKDTLGYILVGRGDVARAVPLLREAYDASQKHPEIGYHLAVALSKAGQTDEARSLLQAVLSDTRSFDERGDAEKLSASIGK